MKRLLFALLAACFASSPAFADKAVSIGSALALLNTPATPRASVILIPGGDGVLGVQPNGTFSSLGGNQLVRTRKAYLAHGIATLTIDRGVSVAEAVAYMHKIASRVVIVGTSRGTLRVSDGLSAKPNGIVLTAGFLSEVQSSIGSAGALPRTLIVHHKQDGCRVTPPSGVAPFKAWGGAKVTVAWMDGGQNSGNPCQARAYHGFNGLDGQVVSTIARFVLSGS